MELLVVRHAPAGDSAAWAAQGKDDALRPLTREGVAKMRTAARGIAALVDGLDLIASSPYVRAVQTADLLAERYPDAARAVCEALTPGADEAKLLAWLARRKEKRIALVGHEPLLSGFLGFLLTGRTQSFAQLKKGAAALVELKGAMKPGETELLGLLQPAALRKLGGGRR